MKLIGIIVPVYNESSGIAHFHNSLITALSTIKDEYKWNIFYIDDGSADDSYTILSKLESLDRYEVTPLSFSRNFGKEAAVTAGLHAANEAGVDAAIILDADGQHPVTLIHSFIDKWNKGAEVVVGVRENSKSESFVKRIGSNLFYKSMKSFTDIEIIPGSTDFRLLDKEVLGQFTVLTEHNRMTRGLIDWLGFKREYILFDALERTHGEATYSVKKLIGLAVNSYISLSMVPLYLSGYLGMFFIVISGVAGLFITIEQYVFNDALNLNITGSAILGLLNIFLVGITLSSLGLLALYVSRTLEETKSRPLYILRKSK